MQYYTRIGLNLQLIINKFFSRLELFKVLFLFSSFALFKFFCKMIEFLFKNLNVKGNALLSKTCFTFDKKRIHISLLLSFSLFFLSNFSLVMRSYFGSYFFQRLIISFDFTETATTIIFNHL